MRRALVLLMAGCTGSALPDASVIVDPVSEYCAGLASALCAKGQRCGVQSTAASCRPQFDCAALYRQNLNGGVLRLDQAAAQACLTALATQDCQSRDPANCQQVFVGTPALRESCRFACAPGLQCELSGPDLMACGTCGLDSHPPSQYPGDGEPCFPPALDGPGCADGLACSGAGDGGLVCEPLRPFGALCDGHLCEVGLQCAAEDGGARCLPLIELGGECGDQHRCKEGIYCGEGRCAALHPDGAPCAVQLECESFNCLDGTCLPSLVTRVGDRCGVNVRCGSGLICRGDGFCAHRVMRGGTCNDAECEFGADCIDHVCHNRALEYL